mmetsp:Transcript_9789/g.13903  ORF Transcript_9789/g.13903 Transcript_9789/m.13903 type:complete len:328 (+) Transcript_9789:35-1018(+)
MIGNQSQLLHFLSLDAFNAGVVESRAQLADFGATLQRLGAPAIGGEEYLSRGSAVDAWVAGIYALGIFCLTWSLRKLVVEPLARMLVFRGLKPRRQQIFVQKFTQSAMEAVAYGSFAVMGLIIVRSQPWSWPSTLWWRGLYSEGPENPHLKMRADLRCYYILYGARYFSFGVSGFLEHRRKDFVEMQVHHWVTVALVWLSYVYGWIRIGTIVMLLLDPADVPLHIAKMLKYTSDAGGRCSGFLYMLANRAFETFAVVFFITRLAMYPYPCYSALVESSRVWAEDAGREWQHDLSEWTAIGLLFILQGLQIYWFWLIVKVARMAAIDI